MAELTSNTLVVTIQQDSSPPPTPQVACGFTYTLTSLAGSVLATGVSPIQRVQQGRMKPGFGYALAFYDNAGNIQLLSANERRIDEVSQAAS